MATNEELIQTIRGMTTPGYPVRLHTLKASMLTKNHGRVEKTVSSMVRYSQLTEIKKHRYITNKER